MAALLFTIADGELTVSGGGRTEQYHATDYRAKSWRNGNRDGIIIYPILGSDEPYSDGTWTVKSYTDFSLNIDGLDVTPTSVDNFVARFNAACGSTLGYNTQYPQHIISDLISPDTSIATQLVTAEKAGYLTILAPSTNTGWIHVGDEDVDWTDGYLEAGDKVFMELDDLSKIYVYANTAGDDVSIIGAYKW